MTDGTMSLEELTEELSILQIDVDGDDTESINTEGGSTDSELLSDDLATSSWSSVSVSSDMSYYILDWRSKATPSSVSGLN